MPMYTNPETGIPEYHFDIPPEDPANPDVIPLPDLSTPPRFDTMEDEVEGVVGGPRDIPDPDKPQPAPEEPEGDPDDNDQPSGNPEDDEPDENPPAG